MVGKAPCITSIEKGVLYFGLIGHLVFFFPRLECHALSYHPQHRMAYVLDIIKTKNILLGAQAKSSSTEVEECSRCTTDLLPLIARVAK